MKPDFLEQTWEKSQIPQKLILGCEMQMTYFYKDKIKNKTLRLLKGMKKEQKHILIYSSHTE